MSDAFSESADKLLMKELGHKFRRKLLAVIDAANLILAGVEGDADPVVLADVRQMRADTMQVLAMVDETLEAIRVGMLYSNSHQVDDLTPLDRETIRRFIEHLL